MSEAEQEVSLQKQLEGTQHILGHILEQVGPVAVPKSKLTESLGGKYMIEMTETDEAFIFHLEEVPSGQ